MSCDLRPVTTISLRALPLVLTLVAAPSAAFSQSSVCHSIRAGETATQLARRLTGDGRNTYQPWFQIMNASARFVPKSQYDRIRSGWRACVTRRETSDSRVLPVTHDEAPTADSPLRPVAESPVPHLADGPVASPQATVADFFRPLTSVDPTWVWLGAAVIVPLFGWRILDDYARSQEDQVDRHEAFRQPVCQRVRAATDSAADRASGEIAAPSQPRSSTTRDSARARSRKALSEPFGSQEERGVRRGPDTASARR